MGALTSPQVPVGPAARANASTGTDAVVIAVSPVGRLEGLHSERFRRHLALVSVVDGAQVSVELSAVPAIDDAAARSLADANARLLRSGGQLTVRRARSQPREKLQQLGVRPDLRLVRDDGNRRCAGSGSAS